MVPYPFWAWSLWWTVAYALPPSGMTTAEDAIYPRSLWNHLRRTVVLYLRQAIQHWMSMILQEAWSLLTTDSSSTPRKEMLCTRESLLFSHFPQSSSLVRCLSTRSLCAYTNSQKWARISSCGGTVGEIGDTHFVQEDKGSLCDFGEDARRADGGQRNSLCLGRIETWNYTSFRLIVANQSWSLTHVSMCFKVTILNRSLWRALFSTLISRMSLSPLPFLCTMK